MEFFRYTLPELKEENLENVQYNIAGFPAYVRQGRLSAYPSYRAAAHWHDDIELIAVLSGHMLYNINGNIQRLNPGEGIFINSRQLHYGFSDDLSECHFVCVLFHPIHMCHSRYLEQAYIFPVIHNSQFAFSLLSREKDWQQEIIDAVLEMNRLLNTPAFPMMAQSHFYRIWTRIYEHCPSSGTAAPRQLDRLDSLKEMLRFIQEHYTQKITLEAIALAGKVCKSTCCSLFQYYLKQTPITFLNAYRIQKSIELMDTTSMTLAQISDASGFPTASYYSETFRKFMGLSPSDYRTKRPLQ